MYTHFGGFESTHLFGTGQDILGTTQHIERWREDLTRLLDAGIRDLRYSIPWHRIERQRGTYDWEWIDQPFQFMLENGMAPIADPLHHISFPEWLTDGFLNPEFPSIYEEFVSAVGERYPFLRKYTIFNEPLPTTLFCSYTGLWYPHYASDRHFVPMAMQVARAICRGGARLKQQDSKIEFVHVDTGEWHHASDDCCVRWVDFLNHRRFLITDLILGQVGRDHALYKYLTRYGASDEDLQWFCDHPIEIHTMGLDYYIHSEMAWFWSDETHGPDQMPVNDSPRGFASVAKDYVERFRRPIMLSETNVRGTVEERIGWLKFMESECEKLIADGVDFRGFCWYPSIDSTDWSNLCTAATGVTDPQGIWSLDQESFRRIDTELSLLYSRLAKGEISSNDIPECGFQGELRARLRGYTQISNFPAISVVKVA